MESLYEKVCSQIYEVIQKVKCCERAERYDVDKNDDNLLTARNELQVLKEIRDKLETIL